MAMMRVLSSNIFLLLLATAAATTVDALTTDASSLTRSRLSEALSSPSGKLTLSPQVVIPEPANPTAILLQTSEVQSLSTELRTKAKANCAFVRAATSAVRTLCAEQEEARGNFPGPLPVVVCCDNNNNSDDFETLAEAGASGVLVAMEKNGDDDIVTADFTKTCQQALECGLQPIPDVVVADDKAESMDVEGLVDKLADSMQQDPVAILLTIQQQAAETDSSDEEEEPEPTPLPTIDRKLGRRVPILGSIAMSAGGGRLGEETARLKAAGFTGALLRQECLPGFANQPSLEYVSDFWAACIGDLKSTKSKNFNFRSRNLMEKSVPIEWAKYQKSVIESGALGDPEDNGPPAGFNPDAGDYQGF